MRSEARALLRFALEPKRYYALLGPDMTLLLLPHNRSVLNLGKDLADIGGAMLNTSLSQLSSQPGGAEVAAAAVAAAAEERCAREASFC